MSGWLAAVARRIVASSPPGADLPPGARVERDLAYGADPAQRVDLYRPPAAFAAPWIALVGGGAWAAGDKANAASIGAKVAHWLPRGHAVASLGYRRLPDAEPIEQARDVARALAFVQARLADEGRTPDELVVVAHSSGAHVVALLAADAEFAAAEGAAPWRASVLVDSAALDVVGLMQGPHLPLHARAFGATEAGWRNASPLHRLSGRPRPILLVHSSSRPLAGAQARTFAAAVQARGGRAEVLPVELSHADLNVTLGRTGDYTARVDAFLRSVVAAGDASAAPSGA